MDLDQLYPRIGEYGRYQKLLLWLGILPLLMASCFSTYNQLFMSVIPDHWCRVPELELITNSTMRKLLAIPMHDGSYDKCLRYAVNWADIINNQSDPSNIVVDHSGPTEACVDGWEYDLSITPSSIVIDFDLVCEKKIFPTIGLSALNMGGPIGVFTFGLINDRFGRKKSLYLCLAVMIMSNFITVFAPNFYFWMLTRFFAGLTIPALYHIGFIMCLEMVGPNYRSFITVMTCMVYTTALMSLSGITYMVPNWRYMTLITTSPFVLFFCLWWLIPESPRWLLMAKRNDEAMTVLNKIAKVNNKRILSSFDLKEMKTLKPNNDPKIEERKKPGILDLCRTPNMRLKTILISFNWFVNEIVYVGLSYYGPALGNDRHMSFFLSALVEVPANFLCWYLLDRWGRKCPLLSLMIISGVSCIGTVLLPDNASLAILILFLISKFAIAASFLVIYSFAGELFPTDARGLGLAMSAYFSGIGRIFIPFVTYLGSEMLVLPLVILGILSVLGGLSALKLPETLYQSLPQTLAEGEEFGKNSSLKGCCSKPKKPKQTNEI